MRNETTPKKAYSGARKGPHAGNGGAAEVGVNAELRKHVVDSDDDEEVRDVGACGEMDTGTGNTNHERDVAPLSTFRGPMPRPSAKGPLASRRWGTGVVCDRTICPGSSS